jgi:hypothetical protein
MAVKKSEACRFWVPVSGTLLISKLTVRQDHAGLLLIIQDENTFPQDAFSLYFPISTFIISPFLPYFISPHILFFSAFHAAASAPLTRRLLFIEIMSLIFILILSHNFFFCVEAPLSNDKLRSTRNSYFQYSFCVTHCDIIYFSQNENY